jgi:hypothetical protein
MVCADQCRPDGSASIQQEFRGARLCPGGEGHNRVSGRLYRLRSHPLPGMRPADQVGVSAPRQQQYNKRTTYCRSLRGGDARHDGATVSHPEVLNRYAVLYARLIYHERRRYST